LTWNLLNDPLQALQKGDPEPFEAFVPQGLGALKGFFQRRGADSDEAEDLAQEVLMKLVENLDRYSPNGHFAAYVFQIGRNAWIDNRRKRAARPSAVSMASADDEDGATLIEPIDHARQPLERLADADEAERVHQALASLPQGQRDVFEMGVIQELGYVEIGDLLSIPVGTVKSRMFHALRNLRGLLGELPS
jgi:RNA polymerase sigma-70 factor, ECF subfamily